MKHIRSTAVVFALALFSALPAAAGSHILYQDITIPGITADGVQNRLEIESFSLGASTPSTAGKTHVDAGTLQVVARSVPAFVGRLCATQTPIRSILLESGAQRLQFTGVVMKQCPAAGTGGTFTLTFQGQSTAPGAAAPPERPNATITGLGAAPLRTYVKSVQTRQTSVVIEMAVPAGTSLTPGLLLPELSIEAGAQKVTFLKVKLTDILVSSISDKPGEPLLLPAVQKVRASWERVEGNVTALNAVLAR